MRRLTISDYKQAILTQHGAQARIVTGELAVMRSAESLLSEVLVLTFELLNHPTAPRCYAWEVDGRAVTVLHGSPVVCPHSAVRSAGAGISRELS